MFNADKIRSGLRLLIADHEATAEEEAGAAKAHVEEIHQLFATRRAHLVETLEVLSRKLASGDVEPTSDVLTGRDVSYLPAGLYRYWVDARGNGASYTRDWFVSLCSVEREEAASEKARREAQKQAGNVDDYRRALGVMEEFEGEKISQSAWQRLGLSGEALTASLHRNRTNDNKEKN